MANDRYIAALEISSSKIVGAVGRTSGNGDLSIIAVEMENGLEWIRYGIIQNLEETSIRIAQIIDKLERRAGIAPRRISDVFIGLSGRSMGSRIAEVAISLPGDTEISEAILQRLENDAWRQQVDASLEIIDAVPRIYRVGKQETHSPIGIPGNSISATYDLVTCRPEMKRNIERTVSEKLHLHIAGYIVTALATSHLIISNDKKRLGCMLVDLGAETTTVVIFKNGSMRYFATIPLGARNITRDLTSLNVLEEAAEEIMRTSGNAIAPADKPSSLNLNGIKLSDVNNIIVARAEEIVANIVEQISYAGLKADDIPGGIIAVGGGFKLNGMLELLQRESSLPVERGRLPQYVVLEDLKYPASDIIQVAGILYSAATHSDINCLEEPQTRGDLPETGEPNEDDLPTFDGYTDDEPAPEPRRRPQKRGLFGKLRDTLGGIFVDNSAEDDNELM